MKKYIKTLLFILVFQNFTSVLAQDLIGSLKINEGHKNITNLSGALTNTISFHLLINKIKSNSSYEATLAFFNEEQLVKSILVSSQKTKPIFLAFHSNDMVLTLIEKGDKKTIIHDIDYATEKITSTEINQNPKSIFSHKNITFIVFRKNKVLLDLAFIKSSKDINRNTYVFNSKIEKIILNDINNKKTDFVDNTTYIDKGFINNLRAFYTAPDLIFIKDDKKNKIVNIIKIEAKGNVNTKKINLNNKEKIKKLNSFIVDNSLFTFSMENKFAYLSIFNLEDLKLLKKFTYTITDFGKTNKVVINGVDKSESFKPKPFFKSFFPQAVGSTYNAELYIGANKTINDQYIVQIGHVDKNTYRNNNSGNFWWNYPAFNLNFNINNGSFSNSFNPAGVGMLIFNSLAENKRKGNFFEINLNTDLTPTNSPKELKYESFDIEKYKKRLKQLFKLNRYYLIPLKESVRFINFDKESNSYLIYNLPKIK